jgi:hypothetical protein
MAATFTPINGQTKIKLEYIANTTGLQTFFQELVASYIGGYRQEALATAQTMSNQELLDYWHIKVKEEAVARRNSFRSNLDQDIARANADESYTINEV